MRLTVAMSTTGTKINSTVSIGLRFVIFRVLPRLFGFTELFWQLKTLNHPNFDGGEYC
jgi:hypothetical protein